MKFEHRVVAAGADYLQVRMTAGDGPMGTRDYQIVFEAVPLDEGRVFVHFRYAYAFGTAARLRAGAAVRQTAASRSVSNARPRRGARRR